MKADHYDEFAASYDAENAGSLLNAWYERPAMLRLAGDVRGRKILDAGCGSGPLSAELRDRGAEMTGFDGSLARIELARRRLGDDVPLTLVDLARPLPYADDTFDDVVASLVLHYLEDWQPPLTELHRVLKPGGRLILSVNHPLVRPFLFPDEDYFASLRFSAVLGGLRVRGPARDADVLAPPPARDDRRLHRCGVPHRVRGRTCTLPGHAVRTSPATHRERRADRLRVLPLLRPRGPLRPPRSVNRCGLPPRASLSSDGFGKTQPSEPCGRIEVARPAVALRNRSGDHPVVVTHRRSASSAC
ncbi:Methyltransferase domain-containing protein [Promicromonospora umidemergens]|uniref:Methyltransferase type 11 domain-containing protein n=1 Tax=Promicromonospora umidemergens TaxID=629679 RepID=A0ABP8WHC0_9MICO|nr:Methyltransferase domain-containing protein [Promicromonospora umidemergens]